MLKGVPAILSPELLKVLCEMGHGDRICIGDGNFLAVPLRSRADVYFCVRTVTACRSFWTRFCRSCRLTRMSRRQSC